MVIKPKIHPHSVNLRNAYVILNSDRYPAVDYNLSFANQKFSRVYGDAALFGVKFFGVDELITQSNITPSDYKTRYPLFTFDVSKQKEKLKSSVVDIKIKANFTENFPANTRAFALVISDNMLSFQSDGNENVCDLLKILIRIRFHMRIKI